MRHSWAKRHKAAKNRIEKLVKLIDHSYASNNLKNFESEAHAKIGNGSYEKLVKSLWVNLFSASLSQLESLCEDATTIFGDERPLWRSPRTGLSPPVESYSRGETLYLLTGDSAVGLVYF